MSLRSISQSLHLSASQSADGRKPTSAAGASPSSLCHGGDSSGWTSVALVASFRPVIRGRPKTNQAPQERRPPTIPWKVQLQLDLRCVGCIFSPGNSRKAEPIKRRRSVALQPCHGGDSSGWTSVALGCIFPPCNSRKAENQQAPQERRPPTRAMEGPAPQERRPPAVPGAHAKTPEQRVPRGLKADTRMTRSPTFPAGRSPSAPEGGNTSGNSVPHPRNVGPAQGREHKRWPSSFGAPPPA